MKTKTAICDILESIICLIISLPFLPIIFIFFLILVSVRFCVSLYLKTVHSNGKIKLMQPMDGIWSYETNGSTSNSYCLHIHEGNCDLELLRKSMKKLVDSELVGGKLSQRPISVFGFSCWEKIDQDKMDINEYIKVILDDEEKGELTTEEELFRFMSDHDKPTWLNTQTAPWKVLIVPKFAYKDAKSNPEVNYYAVCYKFHHGLCDGLSMQHMMHSIVTEAKGSFKFAIDPVGIKDRMPSFISVALSRFLAFLSIPRSLIRNVFLLENSPIKELTGPKRFVRSRSIKLDLLKQIKNKTKSNLYSIGMSSIAGAFGQGTGKDTDSGNMTVMGVVAILPYPNRKPHNRASGMLIPASGSQALSPVERLHFNNRKLIETARYDSPVLARATWYCLRLSGLLPVCVQRRMNLLLSVKFCLSTLPGPSDDISAFGSKIVDIGMLIPIKYTSGLGVGGSTYKNKMNFGFVGDAVYFPNEEDLTNLKDAFEEELRKLGEAVGVTDLFI